MKKINLIPAMKKAFLMLLLLGVLLTASACGKKYTIAIEGELTDGMAIEYTGENIQFPVDARHSAGQGEGRGTDKLCNE